MSNDSSKPPPKAEKPAERPGLVSRSTSGLADAIPTEAEGDALFDELFGAFEEDDSLSAEGDRPTSELAGAPAPAEEVPFEDALVHPPAAEELAEELLEEETMRPLDDTPFGEPTLGEVAARAGAEGYGGAAPPDLEDSGEYAAEAELPVPDRVSAGAEYDAHRYEEVPYDEGVVLEGEVPYAEPYAVPPVAENAADDFSPPPMARTQPGPSVIPVPLPPRRGYQRAAGEAPLEGLGEPPPSFEEIELPLPRGAEEPIDLEETHELVELDDDAFDLEDAPLEMEELAASARGSVVPEVISEAAPQGEHLSLDDIAALPSDDDEIIAIEEGVAFVEDGEGLDAVVTLMQQGQREIWVDRAQWLHEEAPPPTQARDRARALLVVSELYAMAGEDERAEDVAREAIELAPGMSLAHRQLRGISMARSRWPEAVESFDAEARMAPTASTKVHAAYLGAELSRIALGDPDGARRRLQDVERAAPDVRLSIARLMEALAADDLAPSEVAPPFREAVEAIRTMRSDGGEGATGDSPYAVLLRARNALRRGDLTQVIAGLRVLEQQPAFGPGAAWLIALLAASDAGLRREAESALRRVLDGSHGTLARRAAVARALELGDAESALEMLTASDDETFAPGERIAIAALAGQPGQPAPGLDVLGGGPLQPLALAVRGFESPAAAAASLEGHHALALGRLLAIEATTRDPDAEAGLGSALRARAEALLAADETHGIARALLLEHAHATGQPDRVAELLGGDALGHDHAMFAALLAEMAGDTAQLADCLESALADTPGDLAATRMSMTVGDTVGAATALARFAELAPDPSQASIALTEAGLRLMEEEGQEAEGEALLRRAAELYPELPVASFIGMYIAQALEDAVGEEFWLEQRKAIASDAADYVPDLIRRALRRPEGEEAERVRLLEEAHRARPDDYGLRDLYEQSVGVATDRAAWLMERVAAGGPDAKTAALEAALAAELEGDLALASSSVERALELGDTRLAPVFAERYAMLGQKPETVVARLVAAIEADDDGQRRAERWLEIAAIEGTRDRERASEALRMALSEQPEHLPTLHALSAFHRREGRSEGIEGVAIAIARQVIGAEGAAHAELAARLLIAGGKWEESYEAVKIAHGAPRPSLWALRQLEAHARHRGDHATAALTQRELATRASNPRDQATLFLRAAESTFATGDEDGTAELLGEVLARVADHPVALLERAGQLDRLGLLAEAAQAWEELGLALEAPRERAAKLYKAASAWLKLDGSESRGEARRLLEAVGEIDPTFGDTFERLRAIYLADGAKRELADLLAARLENIDDPNERLELEVLRGKTLVEAGSTAEARDALRAALEANPDNPIALSAFADVCAAEGDWEGVEQAVIRLGRLVSDPEEQVAIHMRLGELYAQHLPNPERAEAAYESILAKKPEHLEARRQLVNLYLDRGETQKAFEQQARIIEAAKSPSGQCDATVRLAEIHAAAGDVKQAEQILMKARRQWSKEPAPVAALYRFYKQTGQDQGAEMLLERAAADVRRGLSAGRFEAPLFTMAQMVAEMRGQQDTAQIAQVTLAAIRGRPAFMEGAGPGAGEPSLDDHLAPELFTPALRTLLHRTGALMDRAAPFDLASLRARPPDPGPVPDEAEELAASYGLADLQVYVTNALGRVCIPAQTSPPTLCFGLPMLSAEEDRVRTFLIHRALKVLQTGAAALSRTAPIDLWPLFAAYLKIHSPSFSPPGVDAQKVSVFHAKMMETAVPADPKLSLLASEVIGSIGNRASGLNVAANSWGSRAALLALGDPALALTAVAWAAGTATGPPEAGPERLRWIGRQAEARDLIVFSLSDDYAAARKRLGVEAPALIEPDDEEPIDDDIEFVE